MKRSVPVVFMGTGTKGSLPLASVSERKMYEQVPAAMSVIERHTTEEERPHILAILGISE